MDLVIVDSAGSDVGVVEVVEGVHEVHNVLEVLIDDSLASVDAIFISNIRGVGIIISGSEKGDIEVSLIATNVGERVANIEIWVHKAGVEIRSAYVVLI
jgi:hypothetical protein